jgi:hypothetical protein
MLRAKAADMPTNDYHFIDRWRVEADVKEVADILEGALSWPRWCGSVYFDRSPRWSFALHLST